MQLANALLHSLDTDADLLWSTSLSVELSNALPFVTDFEPGIF